MNTNTWSSILHFLVYLELFTEIDLDLSHPQVLVPRELIDFYSLCLSRWRPVWKADLTHGREITDVVDYSMLRPTQATILRALITDWAFIRLWLRIDLVHWSTAVAQRPWWEINSAQINLTTSPIKRLMWVALRHQQTTNLLTERFCS